MKFLCSSVVNMYIVRTNVASMSHPYIFCLIYFLVVAKIFKFIRVDRSLYYAQIINYLYNYVA